MFRLLQRAFDSSEEGHVQPHIGSFIAAAGLVMLGLGAANDGDGLAIAGGIVAGVGVIAAGVLRHRSIDWDIYRRLEELEKKG